MMTCDTAASADAGKLASQWGYVHGQTYDTIDLTSDVMQS